MSQVLISAEQLAQAVEVAKVKLPELLEKVSDPENPATPDEFNVVAVEYHSLHTHERLGIVPLAQVTDNPKRYLRDRLAQLPDELEVTINSNHITIKWNTGPFSIIHGDIEVEFEPADVQIDVHFCNGYAQAVAGLVVPPETAFRSSGYWHPHVSGSDTICLGTFQQPLIKFAQFYEFEMIRQQVNELLTIYNPGSPHHDLAYFVRESCPSCGAEVQEIRRCNNCDARACQSCMIDDYCGTCATRCRECRSETLRTAIKTVQSYNISDDDITTGPLLAVCPSCFDSVLEKHQTRQKYMIMLHEEREREQAEPQLETEQPQAAIINEELDVEVE